MLLIGSETHSFKDVKLKKEKPQHHPPTPPTDKSWDKDSN